MNPLTIECDVHFTKHGRGRKELEAGGPPSSPAAPGRVPRVARLLALAHRLDRLLRAGVVKHYAEAARLGRVTRARISQIVSLLYLAPDLQEEILFLPRTERGRDPIILRDLLPSRYQRLMRGGVSRSQVITGNRVTKNSEIVLERFRHVGRGQNWEAIPPRLMENHRNRNL
jgi:hypothetical protein